MSEEIHPLPESSPEMREILKYLEGLHRKIYESFFNPVPLLDPSRISAEDWPARVYTTSASMRRFCANVHEIRKRNRLRSLCRVAYIVDGVEGWAPWRPITRKSELDGAIMALRRDCPGIRAWVEVR